ncbi:MAG: hypothetical protein ACI87O_002821 [Planctomycetota bacterium]|jgi:hypothetical protein
MILTNVAPAIGRYRMTLDPSKILHEPWIDRLVSEPEADKRLSLALEAILQLTGSAGVSQWTETAPGKFICMRERGVTDDSISPDILELVASGQWDATRPQSLILMTREAPNRLAWAVSAPIPQMIAITSTEALLFLVGVLHPADDEVSFPSLFPTSEEAGEEDLV